MVAWARKTWAAVAPSADGVYVNGLDEAEPNSPYARAQDAYGASYERVAALKAAWDPTNFFQSNVNVHPGDAVTTVTSWVPG